MPNGPFPGAGHYWSGNQIQHAVATSGRKIFGNTRERKKVDNKQRDLKPGSSNPNARTLPVTSLPATAFNS